MRKFLAVSLVCVALVHTVSAQREWPYCQILDGSEAPAWSVYMEYTDAGRVRTDGGSDVKLWKLGGGGGLYFWRTGAGDIDLTGAYDLWVWDGSGGISLPDRTAALRLRADYVARNWDGSALLVGIRPGIYSDLEELSFRSVYFPFEVLGIQAFNPRISGVIGVAVYPGFDRAFDPRFGVRMAAAENLRVDVMYPESRIIFRPDTWEIFTGLRHEAVNEFRLEDSDARSMIAYSETRAYVGTAWLVGDQFRMQAELGWTFNREIDFKHEAPGRDIEDAWYVRIGIGGAL